VLQFTLPNIFWKIIDICINYQLIVICNPFWVLIRLTSKLLPSYFKAVHMLIEQYRLPSQSIIDTLSATRLTHYSRSTDH